MKHRMLCIFVMICLLMSAGCTKNEPIESPQESLHVSEVSKPNDQEQEETNSDVPPVIEQEPETQEQPKDEEESVAPSEKEEQPEAETPETPVKNDEPESKPSDETPKKESTQESPTKPPVKKPSDVAAKFEQRSFIGEQYTLNYWQYTPKNATQNMPLIIYLHDIDARGNDLMHMVENDKFVKMLKSGGIALDAYVVMPHLSGGPATWGEVGAELRSLRDNFCNIYGIDTKRVSMMGLGTGANFVCSTAAEYQNEYSCFVAVDSLTNPVQSHELEKLLTANLRIYYSQNNLMYGDLISISLQKKYGTSGMTKSFKVYKDVGQTMEHILTAKDVKLFEWMLSQKARGN